MMKHRYYFSDYSDTDTHTKPKARLRLLPSEPIVIKPIRGKTAAQAIATDTNEAVKPPNPWGGRQFTRLKGYHIGHYLPSKFKKDYMCRDMELGDTLRLRIRPASAPIPDRSLSPRVNPHMVSDMQETLERINDLLNNLSTKPPRAKICSVDLNTTQKTVRRLEKRLGDLNKNVVKDMVMEVPISVKEISVKDIGVDNQGLSIAGGSKACICPIREREDTYHTDNWLNSTGQFVHTSEILDDAQADPPKLIHTNTSDLIKNAPVDTTKSSKRQRFASSDSSIRSNLSTLRSRVYSVNSESSFVRGSANAKLVDERQSNFVSVADLGGGNDDNLQSAGAGNVANKPTIHDIPKNENPKSDVVGNFKIPKNEISAIRAPANIAEVTGMHQTRDFREGTKGAVRAYRGFYDSDLSGLKSYAATGHCF